MSYSNPFLYPRMRYDVFICFRTRDTGQGFVSHLVGSLRRKRIKAFLFYELPEEDRFEASLRAIEESRISVIVFSKNFGDSKWCLNEVVNILKCRDGFKQEVITVPYHVDPLDIENQTGSFGDGFLKRQEKEEQLQEWKQALSEATSLNGWTTATTRNEEILVDEIVREIESKLFRSSKKKVIFEWTMVIINFVLEIPSAIFDQLSSTRKPFYALIGMVISLLSLLLCVTDMIHMGRVERVVWRWTRPVPWFYYQSHRSIRFGTFLDFFGLLCVLGQCAVTMINYAFISHGGNSPIKISVWPIMFALGLLCTKFINGRR